MRFFAGGLPLPLRAALLFFRDTGPLTFGLVSGRAGNRGFQSRREGGSMADFWRPEASLLPQWRADRRPRRRSIGKLPITTLKSIPAANDPSYYVIPSHRRLLGISDRRSTGQGTDETGRSFIFVASQARRVIVAATLPSGLQAARSDRESNHAFRDPGRPKDAEGLRPKLPKLPQE